VKFLYAAYAATWLIHIGYLVILTARGRRLREEAEQLRREKPDAFTG
jgi:hypothetical protein